MIDMDGVSFIDSEGKDMIEKVKEEMGRDGIQINLENVNDDVRAYLKEAGTEEVVGEGNIHDDVFEAVEIILGKGK